MKIYKLKILDRFQEKYLSPVASVENREPLVGTRNGKREAISRTDKFGQVEEHIIMQMTNAHDDEVM